MIDNEAVNFIAVTSLPPLKKPAAIQLSIPEPCAQDWNEMQPVTGGRHCASCKNVVMDFSRMTDAQLLDYFREFNGAACGRFREEQLERVIQAVSLPRSSWWAKVAAGILLAVGLSKDADAQNNRNTPAEQHIPSAKQREEAAKKENSANGFEIFGTLKDEKGNPIINARVEASEGNVVKGRALTDFDGNYSIKPLESGEYDVRFLYDRYHDTVIVENVGIAASTKICQVLRRNDVPINSTVIKTGGIGMHPLIDPAKPIETQKKSFFRRIAFWK